jgi:hypothetical protein
LDKLFRLLDNLDRREIYYRLNRVSDGILIEVAVPGQRWEIEFDRDGHVQLERFLSEGQILEETELARLLDEFSD